MEDNFIRQVEDIIDQMECPKDFKCKKSGFEDICKAKELMA